MTRFANDTQKLISQSRVENHVNYVRYFTFATLVRSSNTAAMPCRGEKCNRKTRQQDSTNEIIAETQSEYLIG